MIVSTSSPLGLLKRCFVRSFLGYMIALILPKIWRFGPCTPEDLTLDKPLKHQMPYILIIRFALHRRLIKLQSVICSFINIPCLSLAVLFGMSYEPDYILSPLPSSGEGVIETQKSTVEGSISSSDQSSLERKLVRKFDLRIILPSFLISMLCSLQFSNVSNARVLNHATNDSLSDVLNLSDTGYKVMAVAYFIGRMSFQPMSNMLLKKFRPSCWIAFLVFSCGAVNLVLAAVRTCSALTGVRFLLGIFEAGVFPGLIYLITFWYKPSERTVRVAVIASASKLSGAVGGLLAYGIGKLNGSLGLQGWRWLFLLEGIPGCIASVIIYFGFPNYPETASWLSNSERDLAVSRIQGIGSQGDARITKNEILGTLMDWRLYGHYLIQFCLSVSISSLFLFSPSIIHGLGFKDLEAQLFTAPPYGLAFVATILISFSAEHFRAKSLHAFLTTFLGSACFLTQGLIPESALIPRYVLLCISACAVFSSFSTQIAWLSNNLRSTGASGLAIGLTLSIGAIGEIIGSWIYKDSEIPGYITGHLTNFAVLLLGSIVILFMRQVYRRRNSRLPGGSIPWDL